MRIYASTGPSRPKPRIGDRRTTKAHGTQVRVVQTSGGMWCVRGNRYVYEWRSPADLVGTYWDYLLKPGERPAPSIKETTRA